PSLRTVQYGGGTLGFDADVFIEAIDGGFIDMSNVTSMSVAAIGDQSRRSIQVLASGADSRVELPNLETLSDSYGFSLGTGDGEYSRITTNNGGQVGL